eukprot:XP_011673042.1 PREDICTED: uncharacterized protein LOC105442538 [Strongylocentrotus purpuratus]
MGHMQSLACRANSPSSRSDQEEQEGLPESEAVIQEGQDHTAPLATLATTSIEGDIGQKKQGGTFHHMAHIEVPEDKLLESQSDTLKPKGTQRPQRKNGSRKNRGKGVPVVEKDTAKVLEMYLRRHQSLSQGTEAPTEEPAKVQKERGDNQAEREEFFKRIANRLARIGDQVCEDYKFKDGAKIIVTEGLAPDDSRPEYVKIGRMILTNLDGMPLGFTSQAAILNRMAIDVIKKATYPSFCIAMETIIGQDLPLACRSSPSSSSSHRLPSWPPPP